MTWTHFSILLGVGALHSCLLWVATLGAKRLGISGRMLRLTPLVLGVVSAWASFPLALRMVTGMEINGLREELLGALLGVPAAAGAEGVYRIASTLLPRVTEALLSRLSGKD